jgi:hypothetical protein
MFIIQFENMTVMRAVTFSEVLTDICFEQGTSVKEIPADDKFGVICRCVSRIGCYVGGRLRAARGPGG